MPEPAGQPTAERTRWCQTCRTTTTEQSPHGWYRVTVNDLDDPRGYRPLGLFCSTECLAAKLPEVEQLIAQIEGLRAGTTALVNDTRPRPAMPPLPDWLIHAAGDFTVLPGRMSPLGLAAAAFTAGWEVASSD